MSVFKYILTLLGAWFACGIISTVFGGVVWLIQSDYFWPVLICIAVLFLVWAYFSITSTGKEQFTYLQVSKDIVMANREKGYSGTAYKVLVWDSQARMWKSPDRGTYWPGRRITACGDPFINKNYGIHLRLTPDHRDLQYYLNNYRGSKLVQVQYRGAVLYTKAAFATEAEVIGEV